MASLIKNLGKRPISPSSAFFNEEKEKHREQAHKKKEREEAERRKLQEEKCKRTVQEMKKSVLELSTVEQKSLNAMRFAMIGSVVGGSALVVKVTIATRQKGLRARGLEGLRA
jgi:hypothetical protein